MAEALHLVLQRDKFNIEPDPEPPAKDSDAPARARTSWEDYKGLFHLGRFSSAYIPIINVPKPNFLFMKFSYDDIVTLIDTDPFTLPAEFQSDRSYDEVDGQRCRLTDYSFSEGKLKLDISKTSYWDYLKSGEHLDEPYIHDPTRTYRDVFGGILQAGTESFSLFNLTNICGCGLFILTADNKLLVTRQPEESSVYPGRLTYAASGTMGFGDYPNPFTEILSKTREKINHQINMTNLRMIGFGADARKLYFQFSFLERVPSTFADLKKQHDGLIPINFKLGDVIKSLVYDNWEPSAEAMLLTLLIAEKKYGYGAVMDTLVQYGKDWGRHKINDEWDYRAAYRGVASTLSIRYPKDRIAEISRQYILEILKFMATDVQEKDILEIGSGNGRVTEHLIRAGASGVTCVDICERMIKQSKNKLGQFRDKLIYKKMFAQDYNEPVVHDVAVISLVLIHNVDDSDFQSLVQNVCRHARAVYVFEDVTQDRPVSPYTKLRPASQIIDEFAKNNMFPGKQQHYNLWKDDIIFIRFSARLPTT